MSVSREATGRCRRPPSRRRGSGKGSTEIEWRGGVAAPFPAVPRAVLEDAKQATNRLFRVGRQVLDTGCALLRRGTAYALPGLCLCKS